MRMTLYTVIIFLTFISCSLISNAQVSGVVIDHKTNKPVSGVEVFINKTTIATVTNDAGEFELGNIGSDFQEIILFKEGYVLYRSSMKIQSDRAYNLQLSLTSVKSKKTTSLTEQERSQLQNSLLDAFPTDSITLQNLMEIGFTNTGSKRVFAWVPLQIQNDKTGYSQYYYLSGLSVDDISRSPVRFEPLPSQEMKQNIAWEKKRKSYFEGSSRHWLIAFVANQLNEVGYEVEEGNGKKVSASSFISKSPLPDYFKLTIDQPLTVFYKRGNDKTQISRVTTNGSLDVNGKGLMINANALSIQGDMARVAMADQLPQDYEPINGDVQETYTQAMQRFYEKVYIHTDKPYYYPGEPFWFKGYINYREPLWRDSLSRVMYVEFINPMREVTLTKTLKIDSGFFHNDFILPDSLKEGTYYLRAYTNLNRNFGDSALFVKPIPILSTTDKVVFTQGKLEQVADPQLLITSDKQVYKSRDKITLTFQSKNKEGKPLVSDVSVSVTDVIQVVPVEEKANIINESSSADTKFKILELKYPLEHGVTFRGKFLNDSGKPEKTMLDIFQLKPKRMMMAVTDDQGLFSQGGLDFYDSAAFSFKSDKAKDYPYGKIELLPRDFPAIVLKETDESPHLELEYTQSQQRIISQYEVPKNVRVLETVEIKAKRIEEQYQDDYRLRRPYGKPDHVLKAKDLNAAYPDMVYAIAGKIPGLFVDANPNNRVVVFTRAVNNSINFGNSPLVTINDVPMNGPAGDVLSMINPVTVESVEFKNGINVLYGSQGANGVISVYTKQGVSEDALAVTPNFQVINIKGYSAARKFRAPDYEGDDLGNSSGDYRSTIYWNPDIKTNNKTGEATVSFFAADLPGQYRIIAEGVLENGEPVRSVSFITIENDN